MSSTPQQIPEINFSGLDPENPGGERWDAVRAEMMAALESIRCFEALYDDVSPELRESLFGDGMKDLFDLPLETKMKNICDTSHMGFYEQNKPSNPAAELSYDGKVPKMDHESICIDDTHTEDGMRRFADTMWPEGNPRFCKTARSFALKLSKLDQIVRRMIMESLGIEEDLDSHIRSVGYKLQFSKDKVCDDDEVVLISHLDFSLLTIDCQHHMEGLQVKNNDGDYITVHPLPNSFTILIGEAMEVWSNGRLHPTHHRVRMTSREPRYVANFFTMADKGKPLVPAKELIDDEHPVRFNPFDTNDYVNFRFSEEGHNAKHPLLHSFCGVEATNTASA